MTILRFLVSRIRYAVLISFFGLVPVVAFAQTGTLPGSTTGAGSLGAFLQLIITIIDTYIVPVVFALAFIVFIWGMFRTFIAGAASDEKRQEGQKILLYGLIGFVLMFSLWGIVNLLVGTLGFSSSTRPNLPTFGTTGAAGTSGNPASQPGLTNDPFTPSSPSPATPTTQPSNVIPAGNYNL